jgi:phenylalanyl-tRNA synthetase beta chain
MKVALSWLREFCPVERSPEEIADLLSVKGVHVEAVVRPWQGLDGVVVARVLEVRDHPNSDKLCLARVSYGSGERELVVGVRNMAAGDLVPLAGPGARVPSLREPLGRREIRGVVSEGMLCSPHELAISADHGAILVLPPDTMVGADFKQAFGLDDAVLDVEIEPNRPDLMSVFGVAREVAAATGLPLTQPDLAVEESDQKAEGAATVEVRDLGRCPRYIARIITGVTVGPSPIRAQARLTAAGMRPLSNVVDATNYAMLEIGQPLHPFDLALLSGRAVIVRPAEDGERIVTLDDVDRTLTADDLVIADRDKAVGIGGVMGSAPDEVHAGTADVLVESAFFESKGVIRTSRRLGLQTEASLRFGRGADPENPPRGADLASRLIARWAGGTVLAGSIEVGEAPRRRRVAVRTSRASAVLGYPVSAGDAEEAFRRLGLAASVANDVVEVEVPGYRVDLERDVDLVEEIVRIQGYDRLPTTLPGITQAGSVVPTYALRRRAREALVRAGLRESLSLSFASEADVELSSFESNQVVRVANPPTAEEPFLRPGLLPNLLKAVRRNLSRGVRQVALFEVGHVFWGVRDVVEREHVAAVLTGPAGGWPDPPRQVDFFDAKGVLQSLLEGLRAEAWSLGDAPGWPLHPGRSARVMVGDADVGRVGELHPRAAAGLDVPTQTALIEIDLTALEPLLGAAFRFRDVPRFPPVRRDLAFAVDRDTPAGDVQAELITAASGLADSVELFDVFEGGSLPVGKKSLAFSIDFRAPDRTLTDGEVDSAVAEIVRLLGDRFGAVLRSG